MKKLIFSLIILSIIFSGCSVSSKIPVEPMPSWLQNRPSSSLYFIGIGGVKKNGTPDYYMKASREDALADMASSISTSISSVSVVSRIDNSSGYAESFSENVKSQASEMFQDAELVDQYQTETDYFSYYRILKSDYYRIKRERKQNAVASALQKYTSGLEQENRDNFVQAITFYVQGLTSLRDYLDQVSMVKVNGDSIDLANEFFSRVTKLGSDIVVVHQMRSLLVKQGQGIQSSELTFAVKSSTGKLLSGVPVKFIYSGGYLPKDKDVSDVNANVNTSIEKVLSNSNIETVRVIPDVESIIRNATTDMFIRGMFNHVKAKEKSLRINIQKPFVYIKYSGNGMTDRIIDMVLIEFKQNQFLVSQDLIDADYVVEIDVYKNCDKIEYGFDGTLNISSGVTFFGSNTEKVFSQRYNQKAASENDCKQKLDNKLNSVFKSIVLPAIMRKLKGL